MDLRLIRFAYGDQYTLGILQGEGIRLATLERPWIPNPLGAGGTLSKSCVPDGIYSLVPHTSAKFPDVYALVNEDLGVYRHSSPHKGWGRSGILIHVGNYQRDIIGCIAVGGYHSFTTTKGPMVNMSVSAMNHLRKALGKSIHRLEIRAVRGTDEVLHDQ